MAATPISVLQGSSDTSWCIPLRHRWGEPDLDHAAQLMQQVAERRKYNMDDLAIDSANVSSKHETLAGYREYFSLVSVGERYRIASDSYGLVTQDQWL